MYDELGPMRWPLFVFMLWPIQRNAKGVVEAAWVSHATFYSVLMWACLSALQAGVAQHRFAAMQEQGADMDTDTSSRPGLMYALLLVFHSGHWFIPFVQWAEAGGLARYLNSWTQYQDEWQQLLGRPLELGVRPGAWARAVAGVGVPVAAVAPCWYFLQGMPLHQVAAYFPAGCYFLLTGSSWELLCGAVSRSALELGHRFREDGRAGTLTAGRVRAYNSLWLRLRGLAGETASAQSATMLHFTVLSMVVFLVSGVAVVAAVTHRDFGSVFVLQFITAVNAGKQIFIVHDCADEAKTAVNGALVNELLAVKSNDKENIYSEARIFLAVVESNPVDINLGGLAYCSRSGMLTVFNAMFINLLVLLQFPYFG